MARTKASVGAKVSSGKSTKARCSVTPAAATSASSKGTQGPSRSYGGGNSVCPRETPKWQRSIATFFNGKDPRSDDDDRVHAGSSKSKPKRNIINSDDEEISETETPKNTVLDETIELETLTGENSYKIYEYYPKKEGTGAESVNGENSNSKGDKSVKPNEIDALNNVEATNSVDKENVPERNEANIDHPRNGESSDQNPRNGESSHNNPRIGESSDVDPKAGETSSKGKGVGKKTKAGYVDKKKSVKRDLETITFGEESDHIRKKVKLS